MRGGGASSSRRAGSPGSLARALEAAEERLHEALADRLAPVSFRLIGSFLIILFMNYRLINYLFCFDTGECIGIDPRVGGAAPGRLVGERATTRIDY